MIFVIIMKNLSLQIFIFKHYFLIKVGYAAKKKIAAIHSLKIFVARTKLLATSYEKFNNPVCLSVGCSVGWSDCHLLKGRELPPCTSLEHFLFLLIPYYRY